MVEQALRSSKKHLRNMEPINCFSQPRRQPMTTITNATEQITTEPSGSTPHVHQKKLKLASNSS